MKKVFIILGLISAILATIVSVTKFYNLSITPIAIAFLSGIALLILSKKENSKTKPIQYIFLLVIISLSLTIYKGVYSTIEMDGTEQLEERNKKNLEDSKEIHEGAEIDKET